MMSIPEKYLTPREVAEAVATILEGQGHVLREGLNSDNWTKAEDLIVDTVRSTTTLALAVLHIHRREGMNSKRR